MTAVHRSSWSSCSSWLSISIQYLTKMKTQRHNHYSGSEQVNAAKLAGKSLPSSAGTNTTPSQDWLQESETTISWRNAWPGASPSHWLPRHQSPHSHYQNTKWLNPGSQTLLLWLYYLSLGCLVSIWWDSYSRIYCPGIYRLLAPINTRINVNS